jgi:hypothetical protein
MTTQLSPERKIVIDYLVESIQSYGNTYEGLSKVATDRGFQVIITPDTFYPFMYTAPGQNPRIFLMDTEFTDVRTYALGHELGHALLHALPHNIGEEQREVEADYFRDALGLKPNQREEDAFTVAYFQRKPIRTCLSMMFRDKHMARLNNKWKP